MPRSRAQRRSIRLQGFDYRKAGAYFVTVVTAGRECLLGEVVGEEVRRTRIGNVVRDMWVSLPRFFPHVQLDAFVVMPNHLHAILLFEDDERAKHPGLPDASPLHALRPAGTLPGSLSAVVQTFKATTTRRARTLLGRKRGSLWQRGFYDHIIRNERELDRMRSYVATNPLRWALDRENPATPKP